MADQLSKPPEVDKIVNDDRQSYIGGSEAFELFGQTHYGRGCPRALALRKLGTPEDIKPDHAKRHAISLRAILKRGQLLEDVVARLYMQDTQRSLLRRRHLVRHHDHPGAAVHTDRIIVAIDHRGTGDAEIKTHSEGPFLNILRNGLPTAHSLQLQWSLWCTGHRWGAFIVVGVFAELPLKHFDLDRDPEWMENFSRATDNFWNTLAKGELPPRLPDARDVRCKVCPYRLTCRGEQLDAVEYQNMLNERAGRKKPLVRVDDDELCEAVSDLVLVQGEALALTSKSEKDLGTIEIVKRRVKEMVGDRDALLINGKWIVYCYDNVWSGLDAERLRDEQPEVYQKYFISRRKSGAKVLRIYSAGEKRGSRDSDDPEDR